MHTIIPTFTSGPPPTTDVLHVGTQGTDLQSGSGTTQTFAYNHVGGTNDCITVRLSPTNSTTGVTYNGVAMTKEREEGFGNNGVSIWTITGAATGTNNVVATFSGSTSDSVMVVDSWINVDQSTPVDATSGTGGLLTTPNTRSVTIAAGGQALGVTGFDRVSTVSGSFTSENQLSDGGMFQTTGKEASQAAGSKSFTVTFVNFANGGIIAVSLKKA